MSLGRFSRSCFAADKGHVKVINCCCVWVSLQSRRLTELLEFPGMELLLPADEWTEIKGRSFFQMQSDSRCFMSTILIRKGVSLQKRSCFSDPCSEWLPYSFNLLVSDLLVFTCLLRRHVCVSACSAGGKQNCSTADPTFLLEMFFLIFKTPFLGFKYRLLKGFILFLKTK